jgi:hypothetical protein
MRGTQQVVASMVVGRLTGSSLARIDILR